MAGPGKPKGFKDRTIKQYAAALTKHDGCAPRAAEELGLSPHAVRARIKNSPELQKLIADINEQNREYAQGNITKALKEGDAEMTRFYARTKMRNEGYGTQIAVDVDTAALDALAEAIGMGGATAVRAALAALTGGEVP